MGRIPRDIVDAVRDRTDIVEVVSRHVKLQRRGSNMVGLCPFHQEKTPSFNVIPAKGIFHCFGCQAGGDVYKFIMDLEGLSFVEAVKELAEAAGVDIPERELTPQERRAMRDRATLYDLLEEACQWFEGQLWTSNEGDKARLYLDGRGMSRETRKEARLGYAPAGWSNLLDHMQREGYRPERVAEAGLARPGRSGHYDAFRDRVIVPIRDEKGRVIAFGGRLLEGDGPKYINSPETALYLKSRVLYGLHHARSGISRRDRAILTEGYFDVLSLQQAGFTEAIATCGTALTAEHMEKIRRLARNVVVLFDTDEAGARAAEKALPLFIRAGVQAWRIDLPDAKDPDELIQEKGAEAMEAALDKRRPLVEWVVDRKLDAYGRDAMSVERALDDMAPMLSQLPDAVVSRVAARLKVSEAVVRHKLKNVRAEPAGTQAAPPEPPRGWKPHRDVVHLLWLLVHAYGKTADIIARADPSLLDDHGPAKASVARLLSNEPVASVIEEEGDPGVKRTLLAVVARDGLYTEDAAPKAACEVLSRLQAPRQTARLAELAEIIERSLGDGDLDAYRVAAEERARLVAKKNKLERALRRGDVSAWIEVHAEQPA